MAGERNEPSSRFSFWGIVGILMILFFVLNYLDRVNDLLAVQGKIAAVQQEVRWAQQWNLQLRDEFNYYASAEYVEEMARAELGYIQPGDNVLVVLEAPLSEPSLSDPIVEAEALGPERIERMALFSLEWWQWLFSPSEITAPSQ
ncbi:MAG: septum formation initiator family protein [Caldilineaceae bacterium]|nr:septum formation initiator family protein [Caldilineaceae bacterium]